ncbi:MAG: hypothetical protein K0R80_1296 [Clostridia bacterium]|jgi:uncharacterized protein YjdB|nr:hypothetical protein [Clostridia bacterium]
MRIKTFLSILMIMVLLSFLLVQPVVAAYGGPGEDGSGHYGQGGSGGIGEHSSTDPNVEPSEDENEGGSGNSDDKRGGTGKGGSGKGGSGSGSKKGGGSKGGTDDHGLITVTVYVEGEDLPLPVKVTLLREDAATTLETTLDENNKAFVVFKSEPSGDCQLIGEPIPGYITPSTKISLTGNVKSVEKTLIYEKGTISVTGVTLSKDNLKLLIGDSEQLAAWIEPANASNQTVEWTSTDETIATVENGLVKGISEGEATILATTTDKEKTAECVVHVVSIDSLTNPTSISALKNEVVILPTHITVLLSDDSSMELPVLWSYDGIGLIDGTLQIPSNYANPILSLVGQLEYTDKTPTFVINIAASGAAIPVANITLDQTSISMFAGTTAKLTASITPANATNQNINWSSTNSTAVTVENGLVTAHQTGLAVVTAETVDGKHTASCIVSVSTAPEISLIYTSGVNGTFVEHFETKEQVFINVENLVDAVPITADTRYYIKVEDKGDNPLLGEGTVIIGPETKEFNLYSVTNFELTDNYSSEYFVSMSTDENYPLDDEKTLKTNFRIGTSTPTVPKENVVVNLAISGGSLNDRSGICFILARELDTPDISQITWKDYYIGSSSLDDPYNGGFDAKFSDEAKMIGWTNSQGRVVWEVPRETLKIGGYYLLEVTPKGYIDNLGLVNPESEDSELLKAVHLTRDVFIQRDVINIFVGGH